MANKNAMNPLPIRQEIEKYRAKYQKMRPVTSPAIGERVYFNSRGFKHLIFKGGHRRSNTVIRSRLTLVPLIVPAIKHCQIVAKTRTREEAIRGKTVKGTYRALEAEVGSTPVKVRVIVRKEGEKGKYYFQSIMRRN